LLRGPYYAYGGRGTYDIRHPHDDPTPPSYFINLLNNATTQDALGVNLNYTQFSNNEIYYAFQQTGDFVYDSFLKDLEEILSYGVRVTMYYGDADYICNWLGGAAVSEAVNYTYSDDFRKAGYEPFIVNGTELGEVRSYGNFSFLRVYEAGHEVPYYQPEAALAMFNRSIKGYELAGGVNTVISNYSTRGNGTATHTEPFVALPSSTAMPSATDASSAGKGARAVRAREAEKEKRDAKWEDKFGAMNM
jgi:hypothetical protein